ncbi:extensin family protein [Porphyrobacter sp. AAP60]|uniref:extensin-like domain-containing protein n=1 Tax=Porphyrobacter sp. AAP60 TaxID=1523423 RepID=UPI0006B893DD|nr:extensin family protein [Porphyrobacter sp. AAP60]
MTRKQSPTRISRRIGRFRTERRLILLAILAIILFTGWRWIKMHPEHDPTAPLDLNHPVGFATATKVSALRDDVPACRAVLERSEVAFTALDPAGEGACARPDRTRLDDYPLAPNTPPVTCAAAAALELWRTKTLAPAAQEIFGTGIARIEHLGAFSCRRTYGTAEGPWSEHATANAIDIAAFVLEDGRRISLIADWDGDDNEARFLRRAREGACDWFATVLSPDYNAAHADHFHLDQSPRWAGVCR